MNSTAILVVIGRVGSSPQLSHTPDGTPITDVRVAVSEYKKGAGEHNSITRWHEVTLRGRQAETACESLGPGDLIAATGKLSVDEYTDREGVARFQLKVSATGYDVLMRKQTPAGTATAPR
jgi:single-strand DNA-binding protein